MRRYKSEVLLKVEPWTIIVAAIVVLVVGLLAFRMGDFQQMRSGMMMNQSMMTEQMQMIEECEDQLKAVTGHVEAGLESAELSRLQSHLELALELMDGEDGLMKHTQMMQMMMENSMANSHEHMMDMTSDHHTQMMSAMQSVQQHLQNAHSHLTEAVSSQDLENSQHHAQLGLGELTDAMGMSNAHDPSRGGMMYMHEQMRMMIDKMDDSQ